jgi:hypothetical protein
MMTRSTSRRPPQVHRSPVIPPADQLTLDLVLLFMVKFRPIRNSRKRMDLEWVLNERHGYFLKDRIRDFRVFRASSSGRYRSQTRSLRPTSSEIWRWGFEGNLLPVQTFNVQRCSSQTNLFVHRFFEYTSVRMRMIDQRIAKSTIITTDPSKQQFISTGCNRFFHCLSSIRTGHRSRPFDAISHF